MDRFELASCSWVGFHILILMLDLMHIVCLGTLHVDIGSTMWQMLREGAWSSPGDPTTWKEMCSVQLERAYLLFVDWAKGDKETMRDPVEHREQKWNLNKMSMSSMSCKPYWKGKAATNLAVAKWLRHATHKYMLAHPASVVDRHRANFFWGVVSAVELLQHGPQFVTDADAPIVARFRRAALFSHRALQHLALQADPESRLWQPLPKHHMLDHSLRAASDPASTCRLNPCWFWAFVDEDFVGRCARICARQQARYKELRTLQQWLLQLVMLLQPP